MNISEENNLTEVLRKRIFITKMICNHKEGIQIETEESEESEKILEQSPAPEPETCETNQLFVPESLFRANLDSYTCGVKWNPLGDRIAVATERRIHVFHDVLAGENSSMTIKHAEVREGTSSLRDFNSYSSPLSVCMTGTG